MTSVECGSVIPQFGQAIVCSSITCDIVSVIVVDIGLEGRSQTKWR